MYIEMKKANAFNLLTLGSDWKRNRQYQWNKYEISNTRKKLVQKRSVWIEEYVICINISEIFLKEVADLGLLRFIKNFCTCIIRIFEIVLLHPAGTIVVCGIVMLQYKNNFTDFHGEDCSYHLFMLILQASNASLQYFDPLSSANTIKAEKLEKSEYFCRFLS